MGQTARTRFRIDGAAHEGEALLETDEVLLRGGKAVLPVRSQRRWGQARVPVLHIPFAKIRSLRAIDGELTFDFDGHTIAIDLGPNAAKWLHKIRNPKTVVEKLGVKPGQRIALLGIDDDAFAKQLESAGATVARGRPAKNTDPIFYRADKRADLARHAKPSPSPPPHG